MFAGQVVCNTRLADLAAFAGPGVRACVRVCRIVQEKEILEKQNAWLNEELNRKSEALSTGRRAACMQQRSPEAARLGGVCVSVCQDLWRLSSSSFCHQDICLQGRSRQALHPVLQLRLLHCSHLEVPPLGPLIVPGWAP